MIHEPVCNKHLSFVLKNCKDMELRKNIAHTLMYDERLKGILFTSGDSGEAPLPDVDDDNISSSEYVPLAHIVWEIRNRVTQHVLKVSSLLDIACLLPLGIVIITYMYTREAGPGSR